MFQLLFNFSSPTTGSSYNVGGNDEGNKGGKGKASGGNNKRNNFIHRKQLHFMTVLILCVVVYF
jgi:hypothetical protein